MASRLFVSNTSCIVIGVGVIVSVVELGEKISLGVLSREKQNRK